MSRPGRAARRTPGGIGVRVLLGYGAAKAAPGLLTVLSVPIWIQAIGPTGYATFTTIWVLAMVTSSLGVTWLKQGLLRSAGDDGRTLARLPWPPVLATVLLPAVPVVLWTATRSAGTPVALLSAAVLLTVTSGAYTVLSGQVQRDQQAGRFAAAETVKALVSLLASVAILPLLPGAAGVLMGAVVGTLAGLLILVCVGVRRVLPQGADGRVLSYYWRVGWPMSIWSSAAFLLVYIDRLVIAAVLGDEQAGHYAAVADLIIRGMGLSLFPVAISAYAAVMTEWNAGRSAEAHSVLRGAAKTMILLFLAAFTATAVLGPWAADLLVPGTGATRLVMILIALGAGLWQCALLAHKTLEMTDRSRFMLGLMLLAVVVTLVADLLLVPPFGLAGAAGAFALGALCYTATCLLAGARSASGGRSAPGSPADRSAPAQVTPAQATAPEEATQDGHGGKIASKTVY